jgi:hypothetical protein
MRSQTVLVRVVHVGALCSLLGACADSVCNIDTDCKGERICRAGVCVDPQGVGGSSTTSGSGVGGGKSGVCRDVNGTLICLQSPNAGYDPKQAGTTVVPAPTAGLPPTASIDTTGLTIGNQGNFGACVAFATRNAMGARAIAEKSQAIDFSVPDIWHVAGYDASACPDNAGSSIGVVIGQQVQRATYVVPASVWPYNLSDCPGSMNAVPSSATLDQSGVAFIGKAAGISLYSSDDIKNSIAQGWPPVVAVPVYADGPRCEVDGWWGSPDIDVPASGSDLCGSHAVLIASYDDVSSTFRFMNSWGSWGNDGFGTFTYAFLDQYSQGGMAVQHLTFKGDSCPSDFCSTNHYASGEHCQGSSPGSHLVTCGTAGGCEQVVSDTVCSGGCSGDQCVAGCVNACTSGTTKCRDATTMQTCADYNGDSCTEWGGDSTCPNGCDSASGQCKGCAQNACGGCSVLTNPVGSACGCGGTYQCSGQNATACQGGGSTNACGGCSVLTNPVGGACGCGGTYQCSGQNATACQGGGSTNACGGCSVLTNPVGGACGCGGTYQCSGQNATACQGGGSTNACGGCSSLANSPGTSCAYATCQNGTYACNGQNATTCNFSGNATNGTACPGGTCQGGVCATCSATTYWSPTPASETDSTGQQATTSINTPVTVSVRENGTGLEVQACKVGGTFSSNVALSIYDAATNSSVGVASANLATTGVSCSGWTTLQNSTGYTKNQVFGGHWQLVSPASSASAWGWPYGFCSVSGSPTGTCWEGINITMTRTCK